MKLYLEVIHTIIKSRVGEGDVEAERWNEYERLGGKTSHFHGAED